MFSAQMSLRNAHLLDSTVGAEYERFLELAMGQIDLLSLRRSMLPSVDVAPTLTYPVKAMTTP